MEHGAVSRDGRFVAVGCQDSSHLVYDDQLELIGDIGNQSEYPHYAVFSADQSMIAFNSCHFYNGITVGVPLALNDWNISIPGNAPAVIAWITVPEAITPNRI